MQQLTSPDSQIPSTKNIISMTRPKPKVGIILLLCISFILGCQKKESTEPLASYKSINFTYTKLSGIGLEKGITRRDPSDVIKVDDIYFVYYTKVLGRAAGYWGEIWYATSYDGLKWQEMGKVLGVGKAGKFDSQAVFTPNILYAKNKFFLYYTGVKPTPGRTDAVFENNSSSDITALGLAVSNNPNGPFERIQSDPVFEISDVPEKFDSYRIDDAALLLRDGKYFLFYKGRSRSHGKKGPAHTQMGVATSDSPEGPFIRSSNPVLNNSHEVMIWPQKDGVAALASISSTFEYSDDGIIFDKKHQMKVSNRPNAPGAYRPDLTGGIGNELNWGISMIHNGPDSYLIRYDVTNNN